MKETLSPQPKLSEVGSPLPVPNSKSLLLEETTYLKVLSAEEIRKYFGDFQFTENPQQKGAILIKAPWPQDNLTEVFIPSLKGLPKYGTSGFSGKVICHKKIALPLKNAFAEIEKKGLSRCVLFWGGSYVPRHITWDPAKSLSTHSWGIAFDINVQWNAYNVTPPAVGFEGCVREIVPILEKHGFAWGGHFSNPDGMHFEFAKPI
jgi:hypothetical protein